LVDGIFSERIETDSTPSEKNMTETIELADKRLDRFADRINREINLAKQLVKRRDSGERIEDFDIRGDLYATAMELAPKSRNEDIVNMKKWLHLRGDEHVVDLAAGGGFFTKKIREWTSGIVIAIDPAKRQLEHLYHTCGGTVKIFEGSPDNRDVMQKISKASVDVITSFGGLHHVENQRVMMEEAARILVSGGRFMAADVCNYTPLARHFDEVTAQKSLTGHTATWLSGERLQELVKELSLKVVKTEIVPLKWVFHSEHEMALFFKGLHAYDLPEMEILNDLQEILGYENRDGKIYLNWAMIFFEVERM
jgi:SAM-dependent methyltransferase